MAIGTLGVFWFLNFIIIGVPFVLIIYVLILAIKALKIYINKNQGNSNK